MKDSGFSLVEIIIAVGVAAIFLPAIGVILSFALGSSSQGEQFSQAYTLAQEGMEAIIYLKSQNDDFWDWLTTPENTLVGEYYQPSQVGEAWQLNGKTTTPAVTQEPFTRKIEITEVRRCGFAICDDPLAPVDPYSRKITVYVSWSEKGQEQEAKLDGYVTVH